MKDWEKEERDAIDVESRIFKVGLQARLNSPHKYV